jgi:uncharacterized membrane protein YebE (DUF533 family)
MFSELLGQVMQAGMTGSSSQRLGHAMGPKGLAGQDSPLAALFGGAAGSGAPTSLGGAGGALESLAGAFGGLSESAKSTFGDAGRAVSSGNPLAIGGLGALAGALLGGGGGAAKGALGGGALALLGGIAMQALQSWSSGEATAGTAAPSADDLARSAPLGLRAPQNQAEEQELEHKAEVVLRTMISAAKADGRIDASEAERIMGKLQDSGAGDDARRFVQEEVQKPLDLNGLVSQVRSPEMAVEVYAASLLAIEVDTRAEQTYLANLARGLSLHPDTVRRVHEVLGVA